MFKASDVHSLSDFQRNTKAHLERLKRTKRPRPPPLTDGRGAVVVMDADSYDSLLTSLDREEANRGSALGLNRCVWVRESSWRRRRRSSRPEQSITNSLRMRPRKTKGPGNEGTST